MRLFLVIFLAATLAACQAKTYVGPNALPTAEAGKALVLFGTVDGHIGRDMLFAPYDPVARRPDPDERFWVQHNGYAADLDAAPGARLTFHKSDGAAFNYGPLYRLRSVEPGTYILYQFHIQDRKRAPLKIVCLGGPSLVFEAKAGEVLAIGWFNLNRFDHTKENRSTTKKFLLESLGFLGGLPKEEGEAIAAEFGVEGLPVRAYEPRVASLEFRKDVWGQDTC